MLNERFLAWLRVWETFFSRQIVSRGRLYQREGRVLDLKVSPDGSVITACVRGSEREPYEVEIRVSDDLAGGPVVMSVCSCPMECDCKHVVATLLEVMRKVDKPGRVDEAKPGKINPLPSPPSRLAPSVEAWLQRINQSATPKREADPQAYPPHEKQRLLYLLSMDRHRQTPAVELQIVVARLLADGTYSKTVQRAYPSQFTYGQAPRYILPVDQKILRWLMVDQPGSGYGTGPQLLRSESAVEFLRMALPTGRCHWGKAETSPLSLAEPRPAKAGWRMDKQGFQRPTFEVTPATEVVMPFAPPWYVDLTASACGPLDTGLSAPLAEAWVTAPLLPPEQTSLVEAEIRRRVPDIVLPAPRRIEVELVRDLKPVPHLRLYSVATEPTANSYYYGAPPEFLHAARMEFAYGDLRVPPNTGARTIERQNAGRLSKIERHSDMEIKFVSQLHALGFQTVADLYFSADIREHARDFTLGDEDEAWFDFVLETMPMLRAKGWQIEVEESFRFRIAEAQDWYADAEESRGHDWFGVELGVQVDGEKVNLLPILVDLLRRGRKDAAELMLKQAPADKAIPVRLPDGRILPVPVNRIRDILGILIELFDPTALNKKGRLEMNKLRAAELTHLNKGWRWLGADTLRELSAKLRDFRGIQSVPPSGRLQAGLRPYQQEGLNWLQFLREYDLAGILADDMGLGKTVQALAHLLHEKESGRMDRPSLVVAPTSLMANWRQEAERFTPDLKVLVSHGLERKQHFDRLGEYDMVVTSYPLLPRDQAVLLAQDYHLVILDEAQFIKNPKTKFAQIVCQLRARHRLCLTGTPMENHLGELWSLFQFLLPGFLGDERRFRTLFRNPIEKAGHTERRQVLARRVAPFLLRRRKEDVVKELPPKTEIIHNVELAGGQRDLYETIRLAMHEKVRAEVARKGLSRSHIIILEALLKLRQVCCDPRLVKLSAASKARESAKLELLMDLVPELVEGGRRILLFSQFTSMLELIEVELAKRKLPYVKLTGQTADRATPVAQFQAGAVPLFLISLKAGGTGLNLTAADTVIHYDPWWNPAVENQATDRAHRIGQDKRVFVYKLMTTGTVEEKIVALQARKRELVAGLLDGEGKQGLSLTPEDLEVLLAPIQ